MHRSGARSSWTRHLVTSVSLAAQFAVAAHAPTAQRTPSLPAPTRLRVRGPRAAVDAASTLGDAA